MKFRFHDTSPHKPDSGHKNLFFNLHNKLKSNMQVLIGFHRKCIVYFSRLYIFLYYFFYF